MSRSIKNENDDGMASIDKTDSSSMDEGSCGGSSGPGLLKKGPWTSAEDAILVDYVKKHGEGNWNAVQKHSGLMRCGKSCRLRWANHLRPNLKKGAFTPEEERLIIELHAKLGNKWARMAGHVICSNKGLESSCLKVIQFVNLVGYLKGAQQAYFWGDEKIGQIHRIFFTIPNGILAKKK